MMLCMREGSWWATKQTVGLHHCNCNSTYTLKSRSHEVFSGFWFLCLEWSKDETGSTTWWNQVQKFTRSSPEVRKCRVYPQEIWLRCFMKRFFDGTIWIIKALFTRRPFYTIVLKLFSGIQTIAHLSTNKFCFFFILFIHTCCVKGENSTTWTLYRLHLMNLYWTMDDNIKK